MLKLLDDGRDTSIEARSSSGRGLPRFWVKRFAMWESAESEHPLRSVPLRPGLNIVWSPDPGDRGVDAKRIDEPGHGGGKSLFCRLLRYCLGEAVPAVADVRDRLVQAFPKAIVGCEFEIDGEPWAIARKVARSTEGASSKELTLDAIVKRPFSRYGHYTAWDALAALIGPTFGEQIQALHSYKADEQHVAWRSALTVLSRDQRSRVASITDWREHHSASGSPLSKFDTAQRLGVVCASLGINGTEFVRAVQANARRERDQSTQKKQSEGRLAAVAERVANIVGAGVPSVDTLTELDVARFKRDFTTKLRALDEHPALRATEEEASRSRAAWLDATKKLAELRAKRDSKDALDARIRDDLHAWSTKRDNAVGSTCSECGVSLSPAHKPSCPRHIASFWDELIDGRQAELRQTRSERAMVDTEITEWQATLKTLDDARNRAESHRDTALAEVAEQKGILKRTIEDLDRIVSVEMPRAESTGSDAAVDAVALRPLREALRAALKPAAERFERVLRFVYSNRVHARLDIIDDVVHPRVSIDGELSTTAVDAIMVTAFDLALLWLAAEDALPLPAFLIHDSPREGDLGISRYDNIFEFARRLEGDRPLFQYILTTTTSPPEEFRANDFVRLELHGAPATERLLRRAL